MSNRKLILISLTVLLAGAFVMFSLFSGSDQQKWLKLQASSLKSVLSGQTEAKADNFKLQPNITVPILMYHHVGYMPEGVTKETDPTRADMTISPENFELEVAWTKGQGFNTITLNDLYNYSLGKFTMPENPIIFTFDDGYEDVFTNAVPILKKYNFTGSFAIITQFPGIKYGTNIYATWQEIKTAQNQGMEIVSHTQDHFDATSTQYDKKFILRNLTDSQTDLQDNLGKKPLPILIYPFGHYNEQYLKFADQAGFKMGLTTNPGKYIDMKKLMEIPRLRIHGEESLEKFKELLLK